MLIVTGCLDRTDVKILYTYLKLIHLPSTYRISLLKKTANYSDDELKSIGDTIASRGLHSHKKIPAVYSDE